MTKNDKLNVLMFAALLGLGSQMLGSATAVAQGNVSLRYSSTADFMEDTARSGLSIVNLETIRTDGTRGLAPFERRGHGCPDRQIFLTNNGVLYGFKDPRTERLYYEMFRNVPNAPAPVLAFIARSRSKF